MGFLMCFLSVTLALSTLITMHQTLAEQVVLLDTTGEGLLDWTRYPYGPQAITPGWVEESFTNFVKGINWRSYVVCDVAYNNVNNWLWTPFIKREVANRIYIEIKFTIRDCSLFPGNALSCKETFSLLYYEFDAATREPPPWETESYKLIGRIAAGEGRFNSNNEVNINTEVKSIPVTKKGVYFAFRDQGACISLLAIKIYYERCPNVTINFANFPATPTGKEVTVIEQATGTCVENAEIVDNTPTYLCKGDGKWTLPTGGCKCKPGFEPDFIKQSCNVCPHGKYKAETGDGLCEPCPAHSKAPDYGFVECRCNNGYYRAQKDPKNMSCTQPPSAPQNLSVSFVDQSTVVLSWLPPEQLGGRSDTVYRIQCDACSLGVQYMPNSDNFNDTKVTISGLNAVTTYRFQVFAENGVSKMSSKASPEYADITVTTEASVASSVANVRVKSVKSTEISLEWDAPNVNEESDIVETYEVRCYPKGDTDNSNATMLTTSELSATITGLQQRTEYGIQVRAKTQRGWGDYSPVIFKTTGHVSSAYVGDEEGLRLRLVAGGIVAVVVLLVAIIVLAVMFLRSRSNDECNKKQPSDCDTLEYRNGEVHHSLDNPPIVTTHTNVTTPLFTAVGGSSRTYIDPHTYEDPNQAVREFAREIDASCITIEAIIGGGEFGDVCRGKLKIPGSGLPDIDVAIKTLKAGSHDKARNDFLTEASIMGQFEHPNVIFLQGVVTKSNPVMIITEYMENGSLDTFLRANDGKFQVLQLVGMLRGIAAGMQYLSDMNYVHRDLAARNVLVNSQLVCKIADFGLSREIESATEGAYTTRGGKIPVRWTAPEAIAFRKFTSASDVWSLGIVCWEVMSYGERPYWNWSNQDVIKSIEKGYRLPAPMDCPEAIYQLMLDCWQKERTHRPSFQSIVKTLDKLIRVPDTLRKIAQNRRQPPLNPYFWPNAHLAGALPVLPPQEIPLSELSLQNPYQFDTLPRSGGHYQVKEHLYTTNPMHSHHSSHPSRKIYAIPEGYLVQSMVPPWSQYDGLNRQFQNELELKHHINSLLNVAHINTAKYDFENSWKMNNLSHLSTKRWKEENNERRLSFSRMNLERDPEQTENEDRECHEDHDEGHEMPERLKLKPEYQTSTPKESQYHKTPSPATLDTSDQWYHTNDESDQWSPTQRAANNRAWVTFNGSASTNPLAADAPDLTNFTSVEEWLNSIKMARYLENFHAGGINTMDTVVNLTVKELTELGITLVGHQKKIMNSVQNIRAQIRVNGTEGFLV